MKFDIFIGIDPGNSNGGIAWFNTSELRSKAVKMPKTEIGIGQVFKGISELKGKKFAAVEGISLRPTDFLQGKFKNMETLIRNHQSIIDFLIVNNIPHKLVYPKEWQTALRLKKDREEGIDYKEYYRLMVNKKANKEKLSKFNYEIKKARKNRYKDYAKKYFPDFRQTDWSADAFCLINFLRLKQMRDESYFDLENINNNFLI